MKIIPNNVLKDSGGLNPLHARIKNRALADRLYEEMSGDEKKEKMKEAARGFEEMFVRKMLEVMRNTVPESPVFGESFSQDVYTSMLDSEIAKNAAKTENMGLSELIYKFLERAENHGEEDVNKRAVFPLNEEQKPMPFNPGKEAASRLRRSEPAMQPSSAQIINIRQSILGLERKSIGGADLPVENDAAAEPVKQIRVPVPSVRYDSIVKEAADTYDVDPNLIRAMILKESGGNKSAVSSKGAKGLMQLMDGTAEEMGVTNPFDPRQNIFGGTKYLRAMLDMHEGDVRTALAAYNAGPGNVRRYGGIPPFRETRNYVKSVMNLYEGMSAASDPLKA